MTTVERRGLRGSRITTDQAIESILRDLDTPKSLAVHLLYRAGEHRQLLDLDIDPDDYLDPYSFSRDYAAVTLLSKATFLSTSYDLKERAFEKFRLAESKCRETNRKIRPFTAGGWLPPCELHSLIPRVQSKIERILGRFDFEEWIDSCDWGPGVSTLIKGDTSVKPNKYQHETGITREVYDVFRDCLPGLYPSWWNELLKNRPFTIERGNVVCTVPKNSKTDRVIAVEPGFNLWFQKGLGSVIRRRLRRFGCDLNTQDRNRELAFRAYQEQLATIDFSSASDTISLEVCRLLLPDRWFKVLNLVRSKSGRIEDQPITWEKFSSMGNGFTFELESLIFFAIGLAVLDLLNLERKYLTVFGDDVILPQAAVDTFTEVVEILGFSINRSKSFTHGSFFESCGSHWFQGADVTPIYLKNRLGNLRDYHSLHNRIVELAHRYAGGMGLDSRFKKTVKKLRDASEVGALSFCSRHLGDVGYYSNLDSALSLKTTRYHRQIGFSIMAFTERAVELPFDGFGLLLDRIRAASGNSRVTTSNVPLKGRTTVRRTRILVPTGRWYNFGPWV